jgi:hypothetical protein
MRQMRPACRCLLLTGLLLAALDVATSPSGSARGASPESGPRHKVGRLFFTSQGKTALVNADGTGLRFFEFKFPGQATWQPGAVLADGRRIILLSMEPRRDGPGRPFSKYYSQTPTHTWIHDMKSGSLVELLTKQRLAPFETPVLLLNEDRILVQVVRNMVGQIYSMRIDGSDPREFTRADEGMPYGFDMSPDHRRISFHICGPQGYQVFTCDLEGKHRIKVAGKPGHLYFGTSWSPDGKWILYVDCIPAKDPGHDWADVCIGRPDGSEQRELTTGGAMWFAATYGDTKTRGGGSNLPGWTHDGMILFPRRLPGSKVAWEYQPKRPDVDHFNRDYKPKQARGGTEVCRLNPVDGKMTRLTHSEPPVWDFRAGESPDGRQIAFCRAATGAAPALWVMEADGSNPRLITRGFDDKGADHPRWWP